jgi:hypothetical protein
VIVIWLFQLLFWLPVVFVVWFFDVWKDGDPDDASISSFFIATATFLINVIVI